MKTNINDYITYRVRAGIFMNSENSSKMAELIANEPKIEPRKTDYSSLEETFFFHFYNHIRSTIGRVGIDDPKIEDWFEHDMWRFTKIIQKMGFVKYIYLFNHVEKNTIGNFEIYADFENDWVSKNRFDFFSEDQYHLFDNEKLLNLFDGNINDSAAFEYCNYSHNTIMKSDCYVTSKCRRWTNKPLLFRNNESIRFGKGLFWMRKFNQEEVEQSYKNWAKSLDKYHEKLGYDVTNFFYIPGWIGYMREQGDTKYYTVCACIGIDKRGAKLNDILSFLNRFKNLLEKISFEITFEVKNYSLRKRNAELNDKNKLAEHSALRTCIALVMTRNLAHNYGAHMLINLSKNGAYEKLCDEEIKQTLHGFISNENVFENGKNYQLPFLFQHLKDRMEYMSEITLDTPSLLTTRSFYGDVMKRFDRVRILLNYISGISGFKYKFIIKYNGVALSNDHDIAVAIPSDVLGCQALYNILENIIRNTAKHAKYSEEDVICFTIDISEIQETNEFYCVEIDNGLMEKDICNLVSKQNVLINTRIFDKDFDLRRHSLGLIEMAASAAFLRQLDVTKIDSEEYHFDDANEYYNNQHNLIILKAINKNGALGYRFFLQKPKEFLFVGEWDVDEDKKKELINCGIRILGTDDFINEIMEGKPIEHPFLLYQESVCEKVKEILSEESEYKTLLPVRKLEVRAEDDKPLLDRLLSFENNEVVNQLKDFVWPKYYENVISKDLRNPDNVQLNIVKAMKTSAEKTTGFVSNQVVFLDHSDIETHNQCWSRTNESDDSGTFEAWIENLSSKACSKLPNFAAYSVGKYKPVKNYIDHIIEEESKRTAYEIFEAYHNKVLVLDERIQKYSKDSLEGSSNGGSSPIPCSALFESTNVLIPEIQLDPNTFVEEDIKKIEKFINENITNAFILVHYGILERMYKDASEINEKLTTWAKSSKRLIVTSGRGSHSLTLPPSVCFVNLSSVLYAFTENRNKYIINNLLNQSRRKNG